MAAEWPFLKVFLGELLGDKRVRGVLRRTGRHVLLVLQGIWWEVRRGEGTIQMTPTELDDLADWTCSTTEEVCEVIRIFSGPLFETTDKRGKKKTWLTVEGFPASGFPTEPFTITATGWRDRYNIAVRDRMNKMNARKRGEDGTDDDAGEEDAPPAGPPAPVPPSPPIPQYGEPFPPAPKPAPEEPEQQALPGLGVPPASPKAPEKPKKVRAPKSGRLYHIRMVRDPESGECTWEGIDADDRKEWEEKFGSEGVPVADVLERLLNYGARKPAWFEERSKGGAWLATIRDWLLDEKGKVRGRYSGPGMGLPGTGSVPASSDRSSERLRKLEAVERRDAGGVPA